MSMIFILRQIDAEDIQQLSNNPQSILDMLNEDVQVDEVKLAMETDLDKAWHAIHYLLTGSAWGGELPLAYLIQGGQDVGDVDVGYGPARILKPGEVQNWHQALSTTTADDLRQRFDPQAMMQAQIYPNIWNRDPAEDDTLGYVLGYFAELKFFVEEASSQNKGIVIYCQ